jgi:hypothetical protein
MLAPGWYPDPGGSGMQRYFDGTGWADYRHHLASRYLSTDDRAALLDMALTQHILRSPRIRIKSRAPHHAVMVHASGPNHLVHALITLFTCGLWVIAWIPFATQRGHQVSLHVDPYGNVMSSG